MSRLGIIAAQGLQLPGLRAQEYKVLKKMSQCQTEAMGINALAICENGHRELHYNSCRDRHCPLCQGAARARWVKERLEELLPCAYFHVVFTVPKELHPLALAYRREFFRTLFKSAHQSLLAVGLNPKNLGAKVGGLSILHTWNQKLGFHPHLHAIIPGGGLSPDGTKWISGRANYLFSVKRLSKVFQGKLLSQLEKNHKKEIIPDKEKLKVVTLLTKAASKDFVVYAKPPFGGPAQVLKYLGRYTHRVGISEKRILKVESGQVEMAWIDRKSGHAPRKLTLTIEQFVKKFLLHLLPKGMRKIRYFGYMANRDRGESLKMVRSLIPSNRLKAEAPVNECSEPENQKLPTCRVCGQRVNIVSSCLPLGDKLFLLNTPGPEPGQGA